MSGPRPYPIAALFLFLVAGVAAEGTGWGEFAQFVTDHVFRDEHRNKRFAVVHRDGFTHKFRGDHGGAGPSLDDLLTLGFL